jgi:hypothetical protein
VGSHRATGIPQAGAKGQFGEERIIMRTLIENSLTAHNELLSQHEFEWTPALADDIFAVHKASVYVSESGPREGWWGFQWPHGTMDLGIKGRTEGEAKIAASLWIHLYLKGVDVSLAIDLVTGWCRLHLPPKSAEE